VVLASGCGAQAPGDHVGVFVGTSVVDAFANGCPEAIRSGVPYSASATLALDAAGRLRFTPSIRGVAGPTLVGAMSQDGWFSAEGEIYVNENNWGFIYQDGKVDGERLRGSEFFDGLVGGRVCWSVTSSDFERTKR
jgi:hypothetical protein